MCNRVEAHSTHLVDTCLQHIEPKTLFRHCGQSTVKPVRRLHPADVVRYTSNVENGLSSTTLDQELQAIRHRRAPSCPKCASPMGQGNGIVWVAGGVGPSRVRSRQRRVENPLELGDPPAFHAFHYYPERRRSGYQPNRRRTPPQPRSGARRMPSLAN